MFQSTQKPLLNDTEQAFDEYFENMVNVAVSFGANSATAMFEILDVQNFARDLAYVLGI